VARILKNRSVARILKPDGPHPWRVDPVRNKSVNVENPDEKRLKQTEKHGIMLLAKTVFKHLLKSENYLS
jgi:hypothetical protein